MGFFSRKSKKKNAVKSKPEEVSSDSPSTPATKEAPKTPETVTAAPTPDSAPIQPTSLQKDNEAETADGQGEKVENDEMPSVTPTKKKRRTRISVTTPEKTDEDSDDEDLADERVEADISLSREHIDGLNATDERSGSDIDGSRDITVEESGVDSTFVDDGEEEDDTNNFQAEDTGKVSGNDDVNKNLLSNFEGCDILPDTLKAMLPESWQQTQRATAEQETEVQREPPKKMSYYNEDFATNFLQELLSVGFALVYHQPSLTIEEEKADWHGRSVTMNFKAGVCNALEVFQPEIEWSTMGGGKDMKVLTRSVPLIDIHSVSVSSTDDMRDSLEAGESEEIQCFFTLTTKSGDIHVFEAMNIDESTRLVLGIKNISGRYSNLIVAGDPRVMVEFFDNSSDPQEIRLPFERAIVQVSHAFLG